MPRVRVLLADDHRLVADALASLAKETCELLALVRDGRTLVQDPSGSNRM